MLLKYDAVKTNNKTTIKTEQLKKKTFNTFLIFILVDWSDDNLDVMQVLEHDEFELLGKIMHLNNQLPKTWDG